MQGKSFTYYIKVFGCQMNYADAERIESTLTASGGKSVNNPAKAQLIVVLSCGVRQAAEERIVYWIQSAKDKYKNAEIILSGCLSHREDIANRLRGCLKAAVTIEKWLDYWQTKQKLSKNYKNGLFCFYENVPKVQPGHRRYVPIMTGCNNFCAYCVVPFARGREVSRSPESILEEVKTALKNGTKEIYLLGQNVASYHGLDKSGKGWSFARLLSKIDNFPGRFWIRFVSSHSKDINDDFIKAFAKGKKVSPNLHLPIQSGSNRILKKMNRKYQREEYLATIEKVRKSRPETVFSSDIIVGFPGEEDSDFQDSVDVVEKSQFEMLYSLKYSPRPEAAAARLKDNVPAITKKERQHILDQTWKKIALKKNQRFLDRNVSMLIDKVKMKQDNSGNKVYYAVGKNFENKDVSAIISGNKNHDILGKWGIAKIKKAGPLGLQGELVRVEK